MPCLPTRIRPALAAADTCRWDINAKAADLPLYKYLGAQRENIRAYASTFAKLHVENLSLQRS
jgi:L-alanine-DL-glutamate epimerase-like enolase superfamily enzyme